MPLGLRRSSSLKLNPLTAPPFVVLARSTLEESVWASTAPVAEVTVEAMRCYVSGDTLRHLKLKENKGDGNNDAEKGVEIEESVY